MDRRTEPAAAQSGSNAVPPAQSGTGPEFRPAAPPGTAPLSAAPPEAAPPEAGPPEAGPDNPLPARPAAVSRYAPATPPSLPGLVPWPQTMLGMSAPDRNVHQPAAGALRTRLAHDPRTLGWILRAVASAGAGGAVSTVAGWRLGLTVAAVIAIADIVGRSRAVAAMPATVRVPSAHRRTRRRLARLDRAGYRSLHARTVPGNHCVIDHLVVGPGGIYAVQDERWDKGLPVRATQGGKLYHGPFGQAERLNHALWAADEARLLVSAALGQQVTVQAAMAVYGPTIPWTVASISGVDVLCGRRLRKYLSQGTKARSAVRLDPDEIDQIHAAAAQILPPAC